MRLLIVVEQTDTGYSAYSPDTDGCVAVGPSREEVERTMREAITLRLAHLRGEDQAVPEPRSYATYVEVSPDLTSPAVGWSARRIAVARIGDGSRLRIPLQQDPSPPLAPPFLTPPCQPAARVSSARPAPQPYRYCK